MLKALSSKKQSVWVFLWFLSLGSLKGKQEIQEGKDRLWQMVFKKQIGKVDPKPPSAQEDPFVLFQKGTGGKLCVLKNVINLPFGIIEGLIWCFFGIFWCITIIGIPFGLQCFKLAKLSLWPFGKTIVLNTEDNTSLIGNILWIFLTGLWVSLLYLLEGVVLCVFIVTIPWGLQKFKMAKLAFLPFGAEIK